MVENVKVPLFVVAGMPRGATTFLYHYLSRHPDIFLPFRKELNYFNVNYDRGLDWYLHLYRDMNKEKIAGDISPLYFFDSTSITKIKEYDSNTKVILVVRDPAEWAVSFYHQFKTFTKKMPSFGDFLRNGYRYNIMDKRLLLTFKGNWIGRLISEYQAEFGNNVLIYQFSYFKKNPFEVLKTIEIFLDISDYFIQSDFDNRRINESKRRNIRFVSWLLSREALIAFIGKVVSRNLIMNIRVLFDRYSSKNRGGVSKKPTHTIEEKELASIFFKQDEVAIKQLFKDSPVLFGSTPLQSINQDEEDNE